MTGYEYEKKCAELLKAKGFSNVTVTPGSGDQGIDVLAKKGKKKYGIQCKYYEGTVGNKAVQEAFAGASFYDCTVAMVITNSKLTEPAKKLAQKLGVEVWEGIDAIYLQKNDAEYQKKEKEKAKREEKAAIQRELLEFQQWQVAYKAVSPKREENIRTEMEQLEQSYAERKEELTLQHEKCCGELSTQLSALQAESEKAAAKLAGASWYQFHIKRQAQDQIDEGKLKIERITLDIKAEKTKYTKQISKLDLEHHKQSEQIRKKADEKAPLPPCPETVTWLKTNLMLDQLVSSERQMASHQREQQKCEQRIWIELCSTGKEMTISELKGQIPELLDYDVNVITQLVKQKKVTQIQKEEYGSFYYSAKDIETFFQLETEVYARLAEYTESEIMCKIVSKREYEQSDIFKRKMNDENLKALILEYLAVYPHGATVKEIAESGYLPEKCSYIAVSSLLRQLNSAGWIHHAAYYKGEKRFYLY